MHSKITKSAKTSHRAAWAVVLRAATSPSACSLIKMPVSRNVAWLAWLVNVVCSSWSVLS